MNIDFLQGNDIGAKRLKMSESHGSARDADSSKVARGETDHTGTRMSRPCKASLARLKMTCSSSSGTVWL